MLWEMNLGGTIRNFKLNSEKPVWTMAMLIRLIQVTNIAVQGNNSAKAAQAVCSHRAAPLHALSTIA